MADLTAKQLRTLREVRDNFADDEMAFAFGMRECGVSLADGVRLTSPELTDSQAASLMGGLTAYARKFALENPDATVMAFAAVLAFSAIELAGVELESDRA